MTVMCWRGSRPSACSQLICWRASKLSLTNQQIACEALAIPAEVQAGLRHNINGWILEPWIIAVNLTSCRLVTNTRVFSDAKMKTSVSWVHAILVFIFVSNKCSYSLVALHHIACMQNADICQRHTYFLCIAWSDYTLQHHLVVCEQAFMS